MFEKSPKVPMVTKMAEKKKAVPAPGAYHPEKADKVLSHGTRKSYK